MSINSKQLFLCFIALLAIIIATESCKITIKIKSQTKNKFRIQVFIPSIKQKTERVSFEGPEEKKVMVCEFFIQFHYIHLRNSYGKL